VGNERGENDRKDTGERMNGAMVREKNVAGEGGQLKKTRGSLSGTDTHGKA